MGMPKPDSKLKIMQTHLLLQQIHICTQEEAAIISAIDQQTPIIKVLIVNFPTDTCCMRYIDATMKVLLNSMDSSLPSAGISIFFMAKLPQKAK
jgi:hypothetical protein